MIPKIIHYCWLSGDPYPDLINKCISSWKSFLPEYEFVLWDTRKIDINSNLWLQQAFENKKYAFAADYIRFFALYNYGGIYLDADVEVIKSFNQLLNQKQLLGREAGGDIEAAIIGAEKGLPWVKKCLDYYSNRTFVQTNGSFDMRPVPLLLNNMIEKENIMVYPYYYFSPKNYSNGKIYLNEHSLCIHHYDGEWIDKGIKYMLNKNFHKLIFFLLGREIHNRIVRFVRNIK